MKSIQDNDPLYNFLSPLVQFGTRCHYQKFDVHGIENLPVNGAYIIAPCHQQALMEPLAVLNFAPKPPVFLARADIFAKPVIRAILTFLKILPVYRIRDGQSNLSKNNDIFDKSRDVLLDGYPLCLMAEGRHNDRHSLLPMGKGMFRIAGETQQKLGDHPLYIVPTGIDFDEYERPYANLVVNIGKPIAVRPFMDEYRDNEPAALNAMREALSSALRPLMHDIRDQENYEEIYTLSRTLTYGLLKEEGLRNNAWNRFRMRQRISRRLDSMGTDEQVSGQFAAITGKAKEYKAQCGQLRLRETMEPNHWGVATTLLAVVALLAAAWAVVAVDQVRWTALFCLMCFPIIVIPTHLITKKVIGDPQFRSSVNFGIRFILSIFYSIVIVVTVALCGGMWMNRVADIGAWWGLVAVALIHIEAILAGPAVNGLKAIGNNARYWWLWLVKRQKMKSLRHTFAGIGQLWKENNR